MSLGKISNYERIYDRNNVTCNSPEALKKVKNKLAECLPAFQYFNHAPGAVFVPLHSFPGGDAKFLISCEYDYMSVVPPNAKWKGFSQNAVLGFVLAGANGELQIYEPGADADRVQFGGAWYDNVGDYQGKTIYARLDRSAIKKLQNGQNLTDAQFLVYEAAMKKGVIPSGSTGSDGIKFDNQVWVIKITISIASANLMNNNLSPAANVQQNDNAVYLNFNQLVLRH